MSRKRTKRKRRSCKLCKPGKTGQSNHLSPREEMLLRRFEKALTGSSDWNNVRGAVFLSLHSPEPSPRWTGGRN